MAGEFEKLLKTNPEKAAEKEQELNNRLQVELV